LRWSGGLCIPEAKNVSLNKKFIYTLSAPIFSVIIAGTLAYISFSFDLHGALKAIFIVALGSTILDLFVNLIPSSSILPDGRKLHSDGYNLYLIPQLKKFPQQYENAVELYNKKEYSKAAKMFDDFLSKTIEHEDIYRLAYSSCTFIKDYEIAYRILRNFEDKFKLNSNDYYNFAFVTYSLNLDDEKKIYLQKSIDLNPENPYSHNLIGYELNRQNDFEKAIPHFDTAINIEQEFAYAYNNRGHAKIEIGQIEEGLTDINYSLQLDKKNSYAYRNLGIYHLKINQLHKAKELFLKAKEMDSSTELIEELLTKITAFASKQLL